VEAQKRHPDAHSTARSVRILSYNVRHGEGLDGKIDLARIARVVRDLNPDLVALQEIDKATGRTGGVDQMKEFGNLTDMHYAFGSFMDYSGGEYGMGILSRGPIREAVNHVLPPGYEPRSALAVRVALGNAGREMLFVGAHLFETAEERLAQAAKLAELFKDEMAPVILAGDFNSEPDSGVIALLKRYWEVPDKGDDHLTWPSDNPEVEIDYIMFRPADGFEVIEHRLIHEPLASDHRPLLLELRVLK
jgi:endonuclease/exonuclease/phosphatase family metal-dependent hydrolase